MSTSYGAVGGALGAVAGFVGSAAVGGVTVVAGVVEGSAFVTAVIAGGPVTWLAAGATGVGALIGTGVGTVVGNRKEEKKRKEKELQDYRNEIERLRKRSIFSNMISDCRCGNLHKNAT